jgi:hypothetical protein
MRRTHLRGHENILKRVLIHAGAFNLGLLVRAILGVGTPRGLQSVADRACRVLLHLTTLVVDLITVELIDSWRPPGMGEPRDVTPPSPLVAT